MIITHASATKIDEVKDSVHYAPFFKGCLFFGSEDNDYNLAGRCNFQYNLDVNNVIRASRFFYEHDTDEKEVQVVFNMMRDDFGINVDDSELADLLDGTTNISEYEHSYEDDGQANWAIQQFQGILAHKLGYDCAESFDEQGTVYIAYCVNREMQEVEC